VEPRRIASERLPALIGHCLATRELFEEFFSASKAVWWRLRQLKGLSDYLKLNLLLLILFSGTTAADGLHFCSESAAITLVGLTFLAEDH
jgi:hypothetical protein